AKRRGGRKRWKKGDPAPKPRRHYALAGLLVCAHCGGRMAGFSVKETAYYRCSTYTNVGKHACGSNTVRESPLLDRLVQCIRETVLNPEGLAALREELQRLQTESARGRPAKLDGLRRRIADLDRKVNGMMERLADIEAADRGEVPHVLAKV